MRRELIILGIALAFGVLVLPWLIYGVGHAVLGPYSHGGAGAFFLDCLSGLIHGTAVFWVVALGPYVFFLAGRLLLRGWREVRGVKSSEAAS